MPKQLSTEETIAIIGGTAGLIGLGAGGIYALCQKNMKFRFSPLGHKICRQPMFDKTDTDVELVTREDYVMQNIIPFVPDDLDARSDLDSIVNSDSKEETKKIIEKYVEYLNRFLPYPVDWDGKHVVVNLADYEFPRNHHFHPGLYISNRVSWGYIEYLLVEEIYDVKTKHQIAINEENKKQRKFLALKVVGTLFVAFAATLLDTADIGKADLAAAEELTELKKKYPGIITDYKGR